MKQLLALPMVMLLITGCYFDEAVYTEHQKIDPGLTGVWIQDDTLTVIFPVDEHRMVINTAASTDDGMYFLGTVVADQIMQLEIKASINKVPDEIEQPFLLIRYTRDEDTLTYQAITPSKLDDKTSVKAIRKQLAAAGKDLPELFGDSVTLKRFVEE
jgi:hypothetical protein